MSDQIRVGVVGTGFMAVTHIRAYQQVEGVKIAALCNPSGRHLDGDFSDVHGNVGSDEPVKLDMTHIAAYRSLDELLADDSIDLIDITTPTFLHHEQALAALASGKHVLCEKPMTRTSDEAREITVAATASKGFFMPAMCLRFWPEWAWVKEAIDDRRYGRVLSARFRRVAAAPAWGQSTFLDGKKSGGALLDLHIHDADFVRFCFGKPKSIYAQGHTKVSGEIDHVLAQYEVDCGAAVSAEGSWAMTQGFGFSMEYTVNFERATADFDNTREEDCLKIFEQGKEPETLKLDAPDGYAGQVAYFAECIRNGKPPRVVTAVDGAGSVELCEAAGRSIQSNGIVSLR
ncbi:MAG: Gfo/Idh/MocA family oxidoreductase [Verrucomicrobia subdivision 3 bacterium]|nr:Gfo/Idh/MocA family oxidoreductase [Limisphaerales bacterium]